MGLAGLFSLQGAARDQDPSRLAVIVPRQADKTLQKLRPLVEDRLARMSQVELLDRANMDRVLAEHQLDLATAASTLGDRCRLGALLNADVLLFLNDRQGPDRDAITVKVTDVRTGLQLGVAGISPGELSLEGCCEQIVSCIDRALARRRQPMRAIVAVFPFVSNDLGDRYDEDARRYQIMAEQFVAAEPGCFVVDMAEAREILEEKEVALRIASALEHPSPIFVRGSYRNEGDEANRQVLMTLALQGEKADPFRRQIRARPPDVPEELRTVLHEGFVALGAAVGGRPAGMAEAAAFWREAHRFQSVGQTRETLMCLETALILLPEDAEAVSNRFEEIAVPRSPVADRTRLRDAVRSEILWTYARLPAWEYADQAHDLIETLLRSSLPPSGNHVEPIRCPTMAFWRGLRGACDGVLKDHWQRKHSNPDARARAARHLDRMRDTLLSVYEHRPGPDARATAHWETFVNGTFPYLFRACSHDLITPAEIDGYLEGLARAAIAFHRLPAADIRVVEAMDEFAAVDDENMNALDPFLRQVEDALPEPDGRRLSEYARLNWVAHNAFSVDRDILEKSLAEAKALREEILRDAGTAGAMTARHKALIERLNTRHDGVADRLARSLGIRGRPLPAAKPSGGGAPQHVATASVPPTAVKRPGVPPLPREPRGFIPVPVEPPKGATIESWQRFECGVDLLVVRVDHGKWRLLKYFADGSLQPFFTEMEDEPTQRPRSIRFDSGTFQISYGGRLMICDQGGRVRSVLSCGVDFPAGSLGPGLGLGEGVWLWTGTMATRRGRQTWLVRADIGARTQRVQVLHEARLQRGDAAVNTEVAFLPRYAVRVGPAGSRSVLVGRSISSQPLLVDCDTRTVTVFPAPLGDFVQDQRTRNHLYWVERGTLVRFDTDTATGSALVSVDQKLGDIYSYLPRHTKCSWRRDLRYMKGIARCVWAEGGRVFLGWSTAFIGPSRLGFWDAGSGEVHILTETYAPTIGASCRHGLVLYGVPGGLPYPNRRRPFWHTLDLDVIELDHRLDGMRVHRFATGAPSLVVETLDDGRQRITEYEADRRGGSTLVRTSIESTKTKGP